MFSASRKANPVGSILRVIAVAECDVDMHHTRCRVPLQITTADTLRKDSCRSERAGILPPWISGYTLESLN